MFLKALKIESARGMIRQIEFNAGLNLIVDETPAGESPETGNNVGKTTVLKLIDFCLGADPKKVYADLENPKLENSEVKSFLQSEGVLVTLYLREDFEKESLRDLVIERNFLPRRGAVRRINGVACTELGFEERLTNHLFPGHYGKKPTFPQIISHNIRYKEPGVSSALQTLSVFTRDDEYETLYLFMLGVNFESGHLRQSLLAQLRLEMAFKSRLEAKQTWSAYNASLSLVRDEIALIESRKAKFRTTSNLDNDIATLGELKYTKSVVSSELARARLRRSLVREASHDIESNRERADVSQLTALYAEVSPHLGPTIKSFGELVEFHNRMIEEKRRFIEKELPALDIFIDEKVEELKAVGFLEQAAADRIAQGGAIEDLEEIIKSLNVLHIRMGELQGGIDNLEAAEAAVASTKSLLSELNSALLSNAGLNEIQQQLNKFNRHFSAVSDELYGEKYAMKVDHVRTRTDQVLYKFSSFNANFSSGKKQGEITCFDIAYTLFADEEGIPCYHFLLNDKKELMHDNQLERIGSLVERNRSQVQFVASILRDKLPGALDKEEFIVLKLSQNDKLFRIEGAGRSPSGDQLGGDV